MSSVISPWGDQNAAIISPVEQIEAQSPSFIASKFPLPPFTGSAQTPHDQAKENLLREGDNYYKAERYEEAFAVYESIIQMDPQEARAFSNKGNVLLKLKRYKEALAAYEQAAIIDPNNAYILTSKGNVLYSLKRFKEALVDFSRALIINPDNAYILTSRGNVLYSLKRFKEALSSYDDALGITDKDASIWKARAEALYRLKRYNEALDALDHASALASDDAGIWLSKGNKLYKLKRFGDALVAYSHVLEISTTNAPRILNNIANVLYQLERYDEALDAYNKALAIIPRKARFWSDKGAVLYQLERYDEALDAYKLARFLDPDDASISHRYDMLCDRLKDFKSRQEESEQGKPKEPHERGTTGQKDPQPNKPGKSQPIGATPHTGERKEQKEEPESKPPLKRFHVFLSHSHTDAEWVKNLAMRLEDEYGFRVWLDKWMLIPGQDFQRLMSQGIDEADSCAVCIGEHTPIGWFRREIQRALDRQVKDPNFRVFAIFLPGAKDINVDEFLGLNTWVDFRGPDIDYAFHLLVSGVKGQAPGRWPLKETSTSKVSFGVEDKLKDLHRFKQESWVDPSVALEFQRMVLKDLWLEVDESKGQQE